MSTYSNLPPRPKPARSDTTRAFENYYSDPVELSSTTLAAMKGYFTNKGFGEVAAENITTIIMTQAHSDGYSPMQILDTLKGLNNLDLSAFVSELLNYNRFKTSSLGYAKEFKPNTEIQRSIIDTSALYVSIPVSILSNENGFILVDENGNALTL
jgi:hypothetical protein